MDPALHVAADKHLSIFILDTQHLHRVELHVGPAATEELLHVVRGVSEGVVGAEHVDVLRVAEPVVTTTEGEEGYNHNIIFWRLNMPSLDPPTD